MKHRLILAAALLAASATATAADRGDRVERRLDHRGDRIDRQLDRQGERIDHRLDHRAALWAARGDYRRAARLDRAGAPA